MSGDVRKSWRHAALWVGLTLSLALAPLWAEAKRAARKPAEAASTRVVKSKSSSAVRVRSGEAARVAPRGRTVVARGAAVVKSVRSARTTKVRVVRQAPPVLSVGSLSGLHSVSDPLDLKSGAALVVDQDSNEVLLSKNSSAVLPIASITKLMTAMIVLEAGQPLNEALVIDQEDVELTEKSRSRLIAGTTLSRQDMLQLALMSSENRAAHALSRNYPGGSTTFVAAMNRRARQLGMGDTRFVEATGLSPENRSSAVDLAVLVKAALIYPLIRDFSTTKESLVTPVDDDRQLHYRSTNGLIGNPDWEIGLQKTGYIAAAGRCLVMQAKLAGRRLIVVLLDSAGRQSRFGDAERIRKWLSEGPAAEAVSLSVEATANLAVAR